jgi:predicted RNA binding protein YcfA (HicA-like mRNA interferase family)
VNWWQPNRACLEQLLYKLGFREVREAGRHTAIVQSSGFAVERTVLHATR